MDQVIRLGKGPVLAGRTPQITNFFLATEAKTENRQEEEGELIIGTFAVPLQDALPFAAKITRFEEQNLGIDPKVLAALVLAEEYLKDTPEFYLQTPEESE